MKTVFECDFVIVDVETTGLSAAAGDRVVEIAALKVVQLKAAEKFHSLVNPGRAISLGAYLVNGISPHMIAGAPKPYEVFPEFLKFVSGCVLVAHNAPFDMSFIESELANLGLRLPAHTRVLDTVRLARGLLPELRRYSLSSLAHFFEVSDGQEHRALSDVELTFKVFLKLLEIAWRQDLHGPEMLLARYGKTVCVKERIRAWIDLIEAAIPLEKPLRMVYCAHGEMTERRVTPQRVVHAGRSVKMVGYCHLRKADRHFHLEKIISLNADGDLPENNNFLKKEEG